MLAGIALGDGLISDIDTCVAETVPGKFFLCLLLYEFIYLVADIYIACIKAAD